MLTDRLYGETELLAVAHAYQQATSYHLQRVQMENLINENTWNHWNRGAYPRAFLLADAGANGWVATDLAKKAWLTRPVRCPFFHAIGIWSAWGRKNATCANVGETRAKLAVVCAVQLHPRYTSNLYFLCR
jgi:hypothetical protein